MKVSSPSCWTGGVSCARHDGCHLLQPIPAAGSAGFPDWLCPHLLPVSLRKDRMCLFIHHDHWWVWHIDYVEVLLKVINDFGLLIKLSNIHQALGEFTSSGIDDLITRYNLSAWINGLLDEGESDQFLVNIKNSAPLFGTCMHRGSTPKYHNPRAKYIAPSKMHAGAFVTVLSYYSTTIKTPAHCTHWLLNHIPITRTQTEAHPFDPLRFVGKVYQNEMVKC